MSANGSTRTIDLIVLHCSATPSGCWLRGRRGEPGFREARDVIDDWHAQRGFKRDLAAVSRHSPGLAHIGYHYVIDLDGTVECGRHLREVGAHVQGYNARSVGICLVGGAERNARFTKPQWVALGAMVHMLCTELRVPCQPPDPARMAIGVCGHRDLSPDANGDGRITSADWLKTCPGFDVSTWLQRGMVPTADQVCEEIA